MGAYWLFCEKIFTIVLSVKDSTLNNFAKKPLFAKGKMTYQSTDAVVTIYPRILFQTKNGQIYEVDRRNTYV